MSPARGRCADTSLAALGRSRCGKRIVPSWGKSRGFGVAEWTCIQPAEGVCMRQQGQSPRLKPPGKETALKRREIPQHRVERVGVVRHVSLGVALQEASKGHKGLLYVGGSHSRPYPSHPALVPSGTCPVRGQYSPVHSPSPYHYSQEPDRQVRRSPRHAFYHAHRLGDDSRRIRKVSLSPAEVYASPSCSAHACPYQTDSPPP